jgi:hypothetical protein
MSRCDRDGPTAQADPPAGVPHGRPVPALPRSNGLDDTPERIFNTPESATGQMPSPRRWNPVDDLEHHARSKAGRHRPTPTSTSFASSSVMAEGLHSGVCAPRRCRVRGVRRGAGRPRRARCGSGYRASGDRSIAAAVAECDRLAGAGMTGTAGEMRLLADRLTAAGAHVYLDPPTHPERLASRHRPPNDAD